MSNTRRALLFLSLLAIGLVYTGACAAYLEYGVLWCRDVMQIILVFGLVGAILAVMRRFPKRRRSPE